MAVRGLCPSSPPPWPGSSRVRVHVTDNEGEINADKQPRKLTLCDDTQGLFILRRLLCDELLEPGKELLHDPKAVFTRSTQLRNLSQERRITGCSQCVPYGEWQQHDQATKGAEPSW